MSQQAPGTEDRSPKRAKLTEQTATTNYLSLPVVGLHIALVGPNHLTKLFASSFSKQDIPADRSGWNLQDRIALQELERRCQSQQRIRLTVMERKHVHLYENGNNNNAFPNPCHIVYVVPCDPRTLDPCNMYQHPNIQQVLRECRHDPIHASILLCFDVNSPTIDSSMLAYSPPRCSEPSLFTCWHPQVESSRQAVVQSLWRRCRWSHRMGTKTSPWIYEKLLLEDEFID